MRSYRIPFSQVEALSALDQSYSQLDDNLSEYYSYIPSHKGMLEAIQNRTQFPFYRKELVQSLSSQYQNIGLLDSKRSLIDQLSHDHTYTVTTAHQLNLLTGPLYYIYKILTIIKLAQVMNAEADHRVIPVFVLGSEDHDLDEIDHAHIYGKELRWERKKSGAVGRMDAAGLDQVIEDLYHILGEDHSVKIRKLFNDSYLTQKTYGVAVQKLIADLFSKYDLLVLNMDDIRLKTIFTPIVLDEIVNQTSQVLVNQTADQLDAAGIKVQARPRAVNLFYLTPDERLRISKEEEHYQLIDSDRSFNLDEIKSLAINEPQNISPNVLLRPLYQEMILPNIAFIGGGGELAYWLELKSTFAYHKVHYPVLIRRESILWIGKKIQTKIENLGLTSQHFFNQTDQIIRNFINLTSDASFNFEEEQSKLNQIFDIIKMKGSKIDPSLIASLEAEHIKWRKLLSQVESRLLRAEKRKQENAILQIKNIKEKLFPNNGLQERQDNFLPLYLSHHPTFFDSLLAVIDPFDPDFLVVLED